MTDKEKIKKEKSEVPQKWEPRPVDFLKFSQIFGVPLERVYNDTEYIKNTIGETVWITFLTWRAYCFLNQIRPDDEPLFIEFCSMFNISQIAEMHKKFFGEEEPIKL